MEQPHETGHVFDQNWFFLLSEATLYYIAAGVHQPQGMRAKPTGRPGERAPAASLS